MEQLRLPFWTSKTSEFSPKDLRDDAGPVGEQADCSECFGSCPKRQWTRSLALQRPPQIVMRRANIGLLPGGWPRDNDRCSNQGQLEGMMQADVFDSLERLGYIGGRGLIVEGRWIKR
jgi:hypothetical protein